MYTLAQAGLQTAGVGGGGGGRGDGGGGGGEQTDRYAV